MARSWKGSDEQDSIHLCRFRRNGRQRRATGTHRPGAVPRQPGAGYHGETLEQEPIAHPGLYRHLHQAYYDRVSAIEFSMSHDDGQRPGGWPQADVVLVGPSRVGKTPLSMYLAVLGWRVANVPLIPDVDLPPGLSQLDRQRAIGLTMEPGQLLFYRQQRQRRLGTRPLGAYADPSKIHEEIEYARAICRRSGFTVIDVTDKPIEASADEIADLITRRFGSRAHRS
jgi:regulator of PEP synthase PpsR (kinase-PPPase family)